MINFERGSELRTELAQSGDETTWKFCLEGIINSSVGRFAFGQWGAALLPLRPLCRNTSTVEHQPFICSRDQTPTVSRSTPRSLP